MKTWNILTVYKVSKIILFIFIYLFICLSIYLHFIDIYNLISKGYL